MKPSCGTVKPFPWHCWLISHVSPKAAPGQTPGAGLGLGWWIRPFVFGVLRMWWLRDPDELWLS